MKSNDISALSRQREGFPGTSTATSEQSATQDKQQAQGERLDPNRPRVLYGPELSYFTGKLEAVLRYKELPYTRVTRGPIGEVAEVTGIAQVPALQIADGRWLTDTTPIIAWLDEKYPETAITPVDPVTAFFSRLLEDYADEWLWRPAMHYRWDFAESAKHQSRVLADADESDIPVPNFVKRYLITNRQRKFFTKGDGVNAETWDHVEKIFYDSLTQFCTILESRPFLLGDRPSLADFGFFGPMFRHFAMDPTSARIMRETAPAVFEWVARTWNARASKATGDLLDQVPDDWAPILESIGTGYLEHLCANAEAHKAGHSLFDVVIEGVPYKNIRTSAYRVWCLAELRRYFDALPQDRQPKAREILEVNGCWEPLWRVDLAPQQTPDNSNAPFSGVGPPTGMSIEQANKLYWLPVTAPKPRK